MQSELGHRRFRDLDPDDLYSLLDRQACRSQHMTASCK
jgi:hypothetical protein